MICYPCPPLPKNSWNFFSHTAERKAWKTQALPLHEVMDVKCMFSSALMKIDIQSFDMWVFNGCRSMHDYFTWI